MKSGFVPTQKRTVIISQPKKRLTITHASNINVFDRNDAEIKLSFALKSSVSLGSSPLSLTNHQRGIQLSEYSVHVLSFVRTVARGGIPTPNSKTLTQVFFAAKKCPSSWIITKNKNPPIPIQSPMRRSIIYILLKSKSVCFV